jgi:hypothetical protein
MGTNYYAILREYDPELTDLERLAVETGDSFTPRVALAVQLLSSGQHDATDALTAALYALQGWAPRSLHIGKSSAGWCFSLCYNPEEDLTSWEKWLGLLSRESTVIRDEYGDLVSLEVMIRIITGRSWYQADGSPSKQLETWYVQNHAEPGPHGLSRHVVSPYCVAHGEGTWDMISGVFS